MKKFLISILLIMTCFSVFAETEYFLYTGEGSNELKVSGFHVYNFHNDDEYIVPLSTTFLNNNNTAEYGLAVKDKVFERKSVLVAFRHNKKWYVGEMYLSLNTDNHPYISALEVNSLEEAIDILIEMFSVHAYAYVNYKELGFKNTQRIEEHITYIDLNNIDWESTYSFTTVVPSELVQYWGYNYCNAIVDVIKKNKLQNGELVSPYEYYMSHPLSLCNFFGCTAGTLFKYVIAPFGEHHCEGIGFYDENYFSPLSDIVDTKSNWDLEFISKNKSR